MFVHVDVWYFNHKRRFRFVLWEWLGSNDLRRFINTCQNIYRYWLEMCLMYFIWYSYSFRRMNICLRPLSMQRNYYGRPKTITLARTWPNETGNVTQRNTWHCEKLRDVARTNLTQCNTLMKRDARKPAIWRCENRTFRGENTLRQ